MQILLYAKVKKVVSKKKIMQKQYDFKHGGRFFSFYSNKIKEAVYKLDAHIDRIDNDYTGDSAPYFACVYFGGFSPFNFYYDDDFIEYDGEIFFAKKSYKGKIKITSATLIVPQNTDMELLHEYYEYGSMADTWLELHDIIGSINMGKNGEYALVTTTGKCVTFSKEQILKFKKESDEYFANLTYLNQK